MKSYIKLFYRIYILDNLLKLKEYWLRNRFPFTSKFNFNRIYYGQRGNSYDIHRYRLNKLSPLKNKNILILGCGLGKDIESYLKFKPKKIVAVDINDYSHEWEKLKLSLENQYNTEIDFHIGDVEKINFIGDNTIDFVCSDAVYEHLTNFEIVSREIKRILSINGVVYATFGPLWCTYGGSIIHSNAELSTGFDHLLSKTINNLDARDYRSFYFENDYFSKLVTHEYLSILKRQNFNILFSSCLISPKAYKFAKVYPIKFMQLKKNYNEEDLLIESLTLIYENKR